MASSSPVTAIYLALGTAVALAIVWFVARKRLRPNKTIHSNRDPYRRGRTEFVSHPRREHTS
jgi:hypothetical protein